MMNNRYRTRARSDGPTLSVHTVTERVDLGHRDGYDEWTLVSTPGGHDVLIDPDGNHVDPNSEHVTQRVIDLLTWIVENV